MVAMVAAGLFLIVLTVAFGLAYELIGSHVDADGWLREPFALIPLAWLSALAGVALVAVGLWRAADGNVADGAGTDVENDDAAGSPAARTTR